MLYSKWIQLLMPGPQQGPWSARFMKVIGEVIDEIVDELTQAARIGMPGAMNGTPASDEALALIGLERQLEAGTLETDASYAARLYSAWDTWKEAGSHAALLKQLYIAGFDITNLYVIQKSGKRSQLTPPSTITYTQGPVWTLDGKPAEAYAAFGLLFVTPQPLLTWSEGVGYSDAAAHLHRIARRWRPAKAEFWGTEILISGAAWGWPTTRTWGSFNWGGTTTFLPPE